MSATPIKVALADDHQLFVAGVKSLLEQVDSVEVVGTANNGRELLTLLQHLKIAVVLLDISMPEMDGKETCQRIKAEHPHVKVLMLTMFASKKDIEELMRAGADGYMLKDASQTELAHAIEMVHKSGSYFSNEVSATFIKGAIAPAEPEPTTTIRLTEREQEVLTLIVHEHTAQEIADKLFVSASTVITHRKNLLRKFEVKNSAGLVRQAIAFGLVKV